MCISHLFQAMSPEANSTMTGVGGVKTLGSGASVSPDTNIWWLWHDYTGAWGKFSWQLRFYPRPPALGAMCLSLFTEPEMFIACLEPGQ